MNSETYHPNLFSRESEERSRETIGEVVPQNTLHDIIGDGVERPKKIYATVFGYSFGNRDEVIKQMRGRASIARIEYGRNYMDVWVEDTMQLDRLVAMDRQKVNGEIIGVFKNNFGANYDADVYASRKGVFSMIYEYVFGPSEQQNLKKLLTE
ncbi:hypothetical protein ENBRE01_2119 [Enteropsectra breve]|nr:hypothetical protein ENBRE01_2119 [Enteropsectra breve]